MAIGIFVGESMGYRTTGLIDERFAAGAGEDAHVDAIEEFAVEASIIKVYGSEVLDYCADECVQIHGGYGFIEEYQPERLLRDSRINRIFEGTNEINRLIVPGDDPQARDEGPGARSSSGPSSSARRWPRARCPARARASSGS